MLLAVIGVFGGLIGAIADVPYIIDTFLRKTQPHRVTWFIFFILNAISLANNAASGARNSLWLIAGWTISTFIISILSISRGVGGHSKLDITVIVGAVIGLLLWWWFDTPLASIITNVVVACIAYVPTFKKAYINPASETKITWLIGTIGSALGAIAVGKLDFTLLIFPLYAFITQGALFTVIQLRAKSLKNK
jgi:hypothetical protein